MQHQEQVRAMKLLLERLDTDTNVDTRHAVRNPISAYTCPDRAKAEWGQTTEGKPRSAARSRAQTPSRLAREAAKYSA